MVGKSVVMGLLLDHEKVLLCLFLDELLALFRYPSGSGRALLDGTLPLRYCSTRFASLTPLGGYQFLDLLVIWLLLILMLVVWLLLMRLVGMFFGLVVLVLGRKRI